MRFLLWLLLLLPAAALAGQDGSRRPHSLTPPGAPPTTSYPSSLCEAAIAAAEFANHLPSRLLTAISVTESGRLDPEMGAMRAWPWTLNAEGGGQFFATKQAVIAAVTALQARGVQSIDVGCMQVNLMHHAHAFTSLEEALDPRSNALYAAHFLNALYEDGRDWSRAIAAYHSETPALGEAYRSLVLTRWQDPSLLGNERVPQAYRDFAPASRAYGAFAPKLRVYGAFAASLTNR